MSWVEASCRIHAPVGKVFGVVSDIRRYAAAVPHVVGYEFLSDVTTGVGARFSETRRQGGKEQVTELEVTEFVPGQCVRMVADSGGTVWDSVFRTSSEGVETRLSLEMEARPRRFLMKLMLPILRGAVRRQVERDLGHVKDFCEC